MADMRDSHTGELLMGFRRRTNHRNRAPTTPMNQLRHPLMITRFPAEILYNIIIFLPSDQDVVNLALVCQFFNKTIIDYAWQLRHLHICDPITPDPSSSLSVSRQSKHAYIDRRDISDGIIQINGHIAHPLPVLDKFLVILTRVVTEASNKNHHFLAKYLNCPQPQTSFTDLLTHLFQLRLEVIPIRGRCKTRDYRERNDKYVQAQISYERDKVLVNHVQLKAMTLQLVLSHLSLHPELCLIPVRAWSFRKSQWIVYQHPEMESLFHNNVLLACSQTPIKEQPLMDTAQQSTVAIVPSYTAGLTRIQGLGDRLGINIEFLLHITNFFRYHMKNSNGFLFQSVNIHTATDERLRPEHYPRIGWNVSLAKEGCISKKLSTHWIGSYAAIAPAELEKLRALPDDHREIISDFGPENTDFYLKGFQAIEFNFNPSTFEDPDLDWMQYFTNSAPFVTTVVPGSPFPHPHRHSSPKFPKVIPFRGKIQDGELWNIAGHLYCLPHQSENGGQIGGFQRINFIKYLQNEFKEVIELVLYEGIVLPGSIVILGRWWIPLLWDEDEFDCNSGPFVMWAGRTQLQTN